MRGLCVVAAVTLLFLVRATTASIFDSLAIDGVKKDTG